MSGPRPLKLSRLQGENRYTRRRKEITKEEEAARPSSESAIRIFSSRHRTEQQFRKRPRGSQISH